MSPKTVLAHGSACFGMYLQHVDLLSRPAAYDHGRHVWSDLADEPRYSRSECIQRAPGVMALYLGRTVSASRCLSGELSIDDLVNYGYNHYGVDFTALNPLIDTIRPNPLANESLIGRVVTGPGRISLTEFMGGVPVHASFDYALGVVSARSPLVSA